MSTHLWRAASGRSGAEPREPRRARGD
ncbi:hypothetical protein F4X10_13790 [Candidatus Poribacteria bacterium]|nr:hypothetical protein [Candidatus Poribacteria bacterium]